MFLPTPAWLDVQDTLRRAFNLQPVLNHSFVPLYAPLAGFLKVSL